MEKCEPGESVNHGIKKLKSVNQIYANQNYVNQKMIVTVKKFEKSSHNSGSRTNLMINFHVYF